MALLQAEAGPPQTLGLTAGQHWLSTWTLVPTEHYSLPMMTSPPALGYHAVDPSHIQQDPGSVGALSLSPSLPFPSPPLPAPLTQPYRPFECLGLSWDIVKYLPYPSPSSQTYN